MEDFFQQGKQQDLELRWFLQISLVITKTVNIRKLLPQPLGVPQPW